MFKKYVEMYGGFSDLVKRKSLILLILEIEKLAGYDSNDETSVFKDYETAWVYERNLFGKTTSVFYFSMNDKKWHQQKIIK